MIVHHLISTTTVYDFNQKHTANVILAVFNQPDLMRPWLAWLLTPRV